MRLPARPPSLPPCPQTWKEILHRFHCSTDNYVKLSKIGNERSSYYLATVITNRKQVCLKDCLEKWTEEQEGVPAR